jgi:hypothetical protein
MHTIRKTVMLMAVAVAVAGSGLAQQTLRITAEVSGARRSPLVKVMVGSQSIGKTEKGQIRFGGVPAQVLDVKPREGIFLVVDVKVKATDAMHIGMLNPVVIDQDGKSYLPRFVSTSGDQTFPGGMIIDGKRKELGVGPLIMYRTEAALSLCFEVPPKSQNLRLKIAPLSSMVPISMRPVVK